MPMVHLKEFLHEEYGIERQLVSQRKGPNAFCQLLSTLYGDVHSIHQSSCKTCVVMWIVVCIGMYRSVQK
jgi:hypothetical protein